MATLILHIYENGRLFNKNLNFKEETIVFAGHLTIKNGYLYAILMVKGEDGRTKQKWIALHLKEAGNKQRAEEMLMELQQSYQSKAPTVEDNSTALFSDYMKSWLERMRY